MKVLNKMYSKFVAIASMLVFGFGTVDAQETITVDPITLNPGEEAEVVVKYSSTVVRSGFDTNITLPEGLSFVKNSKGKVVTLGESTGDSHVKSEKLLDEEKTLQLIVFSMDKEDLYDGTLYTFKVQADENLAESSEITFTKVIFNGGEYLEDFVVPVTKGTPTGISNVETSVENAASFNLGGVKFGKCGIRVQKGKKFVQK